MKERASTLSQYEQESSAESRIHAWQAAIKMIVAHPFIGVGLSAFGVAFFSYRQPREAHNTFFQIAAESGLIAGFMYLFLLWSNVVNLLQNSRIIIADDPAQKKDFLYFANEALLASIIGFATCAMFLSLQVYEIFYFLCMLISSVTYLSSKRGMKSI